MEGGLRRSWVGQLTTELTTRGPAVVVLEATGGLETLLVAALATAGLPVVVVNPRQVRDFANATRRLAPIHRKDECRGVLKG